MSSINRGMIFETKDLEQRKLIKEIISKEVLHIPDLKGCMFFNDDEVTTIAASLAGKIKDKIIGLQELTGENSGEVPVIEEGKVWETDPTFLDHFVHTLAVNVNTDDMSLAKFIFVDIRSGRNITDTELIQLYTRVCKQVPFKGVLHIPTSAEKKTQYDIFFVPSTMDVCIEQNMAGAPAFVLGIGRPSSELEQEAYKEAFPEATEIPDKHIEHILFPYGSIAEIYDEMLAFLMEKNYEFLSLGISRSKGDSPVFAEVKDLKELYDALCLQHEQIEYYGRVQANVINLVNKEKTV